MKVQKQYKKSFTTVDNSVLNDTNLSWKAKGLFVYLWSQADEWDYYETEIVKHSTDGVRSMRSGIHELEENGYLTRKRERVGNRLKGSIWVLSDTPQKSQSVNLQNVSLQKGTLTNTNNNNTNNNKSVFTQDSNNTKGIGILAESDNDNKNRGKTKNKENNKKDNEDNKESNRVKDKDRVNTNKDLEGSIDNECSKDKKESKGRGSSVDTKLDNTCKIDNECSIEDEKKHSHGIDNECSKENACNKSLKGSKDNFDYKRFIEWFNELANKNFRDTETNRKMIRSRLNEGYTKEDVAKVVRLKVKQWKDNQKMNKYLRFTTLFAATNFSNYLQEAEDTLDPQERKERESSVKEKQRKIDPVEEKIFQYKLFLREHPDNEMVRKALEELEQNKE